MKRVKRLKDKGEGWPTTRCYPRTLAEAFPKDPANAEWFFAPPKERGALENFMLGAAFWIWVGLVYWWSGT